MAHNSMYDHFIKGLEEKSQLELSLYFQKQRALEQWRNSKEMKKLREEITEDVLERISVNIENRVRQVLDELFKDFNV